MVEKVKVYTTPTWPYCYLAKEFFQKRNIEYEEIDVSADANAREELIKASGQLAVPVIAIDDKIVVGFDQAKIESLL